MKRIKTQKLRLKTELNKNNMKIFSIIKVLFVIICIVSTSCAYLADEELPANKANKKRSGMRFVSRYDIEEGGMKYVCYTTGDGLFILNITRDSLEVEKLRSGKK